MTTDEKQRAGWHIEWAGSEAGPWTPDYAHVMGEEDVWRRDVYEGTPIKCAPTTVLTETHAENTLD